MIGVPGKYKGCETCRRRRVKCSNERPHCRNCTTSGRECEGYERDRVFIIGTPASKGRVASHPKKSSRSSRSPTPRTSPKPRSPAVVPRQFDLDIKQMHPFTPAWDDTLSVSNQGVQESMLLASLQTDLDSTYQHESSPGSSVFSVSLPDYIPTDLPRSIGPNGFAVTAKCIAQAKGTTNGTDIADNYCAFLFEHSASATSRKFASGDIDEVQQLGPGHYSQFPAHHYFVRVYRPMVIAVALLSRQESFLSSFEWTTVPWLYQPKSQFDQLLDTILALPAIFAEADVLATLKPTLNRRDRAQEMLRRCRGLAEQFQGWLKLAFEGGPPPFWTDQIGTLGGEMQFENPYTFRDGLTGLAFLYYWMSQIMLQRCMNDLQHLTLQSGIDSYSDGWSGLPHGMVHYQDCQILGASICRGLDAVLNSTAQPDLLLAPMTVALDLYRDMSMASQHGVFELMWPESFRARLTTRGQHVADVIQGQDSWVKLASF